ncbi:MAG: hypothetical protein WC554_09240 [Clostridia bacterium]
MKKILLVVIVLLVLLLSSCTAADIASNNLSRAADSFEVNRRIVFYNGITGDYMLEIDGLCSLGNSDMSGELSVTCKTGAGIYKKHFLGLSDNVTYFVEQIEPVQADPYHYRVIFRPSVILPDIDLQLP